MILRPTARLPVKDSLFTIGWLISASPVGSPGPVTMFSTPGGSPVLGDQLGQPEHRERGVLRRLEHDGAAGRQRRGGLLREQQQRRVPRDHGADHADRLAQREHHVIAALVRRQRLAGQLVHPAGVMLEEIGDERRGGGIDRAEAQRDAVIQRLQPQQLVAVRPDQVRDRPQHPDPLGGPRPRPGPLVKGPPRRAHREVDIGGRGDRERGNVLAGRGMPMVPGLAVWAAATARR